IRRGPLNNMKMKVGEPRSPATAKKAPRNAPPGVNERPHHTTPAHQAQIIQTPTESATRANRNKPRSFITDKSMLSPSTGENGVSCVGFISHSLFLKYGPDEQVTFTIHLKVRRHERYLEGFVC